MTDKSGISSAPLTASLPSKSPLFQNLPALTVKTKDIGELKLRRILCRTPEMDTLIRAECAKLIDDWKQKAFAYDGLIIKWWMVWVKEKRGWLGRFKGVFRYRFGRLDSEDRSFNFIPRG